MMLAEGIDKNQMIGRIGIFRAHRSAGGCFEVKANKMIFFSSNTACAPRAE